MSEPLKKKAKQQKLFAFLTKAPSNKTSKMIDVDIVAEDADGNMQLADLEPFSKQQQIQDTANDVKETGNDIGPEMDVQEDTNINDIGDFIGEE